jgi:dihydrofolate synthase/folylpolyglutamate synthase
VLGSTIAEIASDKVGIFRAEGIAVLATTNAIIVEIARHRAGLIGATLWEFEDSYALEQNELAIGGRVITLRTPYDRYEDVLVSLHGIHQGVNAATAIVAAEAFLGRALGEDVVMSTMRTIRMPGRMELLAHNPTIVVDGAHNPAGMRALVAALDGAFHVSGSRRCVVGMLQGRDVHDMVEPLVQLGFTEFHCCAPNSSRAVSAHEVATAIIDLGGVAYEHPSVATALAHARELSSDDDLIVVAGSLYLVAEVRGEVLHVPSRHLA